MKLTIPALAVWTSLVTVGAARPQLQEAPKVVVPLPAVDDIKTTWIAPEKPDAPALGRPAPPAPALPKAQVDAAGPLVRQSVERVHFDEPGDGRVWAMGANYKASFGAEGVVYVPFFGSDAERSFPIRLRLAAARLGGRTLPLSGAPVPRRVGSAVELDRGALVERHHVGLWTLEQTFELDALPYAGDLEITLDVESEFELVDAAEGLVLRNDHGAVAYGDVTVVDARGRELRTPSRVEGDSIALSVPAAFLADAELPLVVDPVVSNFYIDPSRDAITADTAYDATTDTYLVTFEQIWSSSDHDVQSVVLDAAGDVVVGSEQYIDFTTETWRAPMVANNNIADQFLAVATRGANGSRAIWGRTRQANSATLGSQFRISGSFVGEKLDPDVGGDPVTVGPTYYCVVWRRVYSSTDSDIHYQLVRSDSTLLSSSTQYIDNSGGTIDFTPEVSKSNGIAPYATQRWNVTFNRVYTSSDRDIRGAQIDWDGTLVTPSFSIDYSGEDHLYPQPSSPLDGGFGERDWACVYQRDGGSDWDVKMAALKGDEDFQRSILTDLEAAVVGSSWAGQDQGGPHVTADGDQFLVTYHELYGTSSTDWDVYCATVRHDGDTFTCVDAHRNLAFSSAGEAWARVTSRRDAGGAPGRFLVAWHDNSSSGENNIEGALFDVEDTWRDIGDPLCSATSNSTGAGAYMRVLGSDRRSDNRVLFDVDNLPGSAAGFFLMSTTSGSLSVGQGLLCLGSPFQRLSNFALNSGFHGAASLHLDLDALPSSAAVTPGSTWHFQYWYRDSIGGAATSNLSNAESVSFD